MKLRETDYDLPFKIERIQFPITLAYVITINKAQGQTFDKIGLELRNPVFSHGQLYVSCSRVRMFDNLKIRVSNTQEQGNLPNIPGTCTKNLVYREILVNIFKFFSNIFSITIVININVINNKQLISFVFLVFTLIYFILCYIGLLLIKKISIKIIYFFAIFLYFLN